MAELDWAYYLYPSVWNEIKFNLYRGIKLLYKSELPEYVKNFCKKTSVELIPYDEKDDYNLSSERLFSIKNEWITEDNQVSFDINELWAESWDDITDEKTLYIECNYYNVCTTLYNLKEYVHRSIVKGWIELGYNVIPLFWKEDISLLNEQQVILIEKFNNIALPSVEDMDKYVCRKSLFPEVKDEITERKYIHIISSDGGEVLPYYRRYFLNNLLKEKWGDELYTNAFLGINKAKLCILSHPSYYIPESEKLFYDRTDNWNGSGMDKDREDDVLAKADYITCSSKWLYNDTVDWLNKNRKNVDVKVKYIPNGNTMFEYPTNVEKFEKKTAVYIGARIKKTDLQLLYLLCEMNPDWNFMIYGEDSTNLLSIPSNLIVHETIPMEELYPILCKCHIGLCLLKPTNWTVGMLPNKVFSYFNARLPVIYSGIPDINMEDYSECAFNISDVTSLNEIVEKNISDDIFKKYERSWDDVCKEVYSCIQELEE